MNRRAALSLAGIAALRAAAPTLAQTPTVSPTPVRPGLIGGSALDALQKGENGNLSVARLSPAYTRNDSKVGIVVIFRNNTSANIYGNCSQLWAAPAANGHW